MFYRLGRPVFGMATPNFLEMNWDTCWTPGYWTNLITEKEFEKDPLSLPQGDFIMEEIMPIILDVVDQLKLPTSGVVSLANLGCVPGSNTICTVTAIIERMQKTLQPDKMPEFLACLQDFAGTNIHTLTALLNRQEKAPAYRPYWVGAFPGSLYKLMLPFSTFHFVISLFALHWLSRVPPEVLDNSSPAYDGDHSGLHISSIVTLKAYERQAEEDLELFLSIRAKETVPGAVMILTFGLRKVHLPYNVGMPVILDEMIWGQILSHSSLEEELRVSHVYYRTMEEVDRVLSRFKQEFGVEKKWLYPGPLECYSPQQVQKIVDDVTLKLKYFGSSEGNVLKSHFGEAGKDWFLNFNKGGLSILVLVLRRR